MLKELQNIPDSDRRWFSDDFFDLIVWYDAERRVSGFQLCYNLQGIEHALTWQDGKGTDHHRIDSGEASPLKNMTPVLFPDGAVPYDELVRQFTDRAAAIDAAIYSLVIQKISEGLRAKGT